MNYFKLLARIRMKFSCDHYGSTIFSVQCIDFSPSFKQFSNKLNCDLRFLKIKGHLRSIWGYSGWNRHESVLSCDFNRVILGHLNQVLTQSWEVEDYFYLRSVYTSGHLKNVFKYEEIFRDRFSILIAQILVLYSGFIDALVRC